MTVVNGLVSQDAEFGSWTNSSTYILDGQISSAFRVPSVSITGKSAKYSINLNIFRASYFKQINKRIFSCRFTHHNWDYTWSKR